MCLFEAIIGASHESTAGDFGMLAQFAHSDGPPGIFIFFFVLIAVVIIGGIIFSIGKGVTEWADNNQQPVLTVQAKVVTKHADTSVYRHTDKNVGTHSSTSYYATFEFASGDRKEFELSEHEYGLLAESDSGQLTFQGTRFKGFQRHSDDAKTTAAAPEQSGAATVSETASARPASAHSFCPYCGVEIQGSFKFCPHCGKEQPAYDANT